MSEQFDPFQNDGQVLTVGGLTIENSTESLSIYGTTDIAITDVQTIELLMNLFSSAWHKAVVKKSRFK